jgi:hypothetical protein
MWAVKETGTEAWPIPMPIRSTLTRAIFAWKASPTPPMKRGAAAPLRLTVASA